MPNPKKHKHLKQIKTSNTVNYGSTETEVVNTENSPQNENENTEQTSNFRHYLRLWHAIDITSFIFSMVYVMNAANAYDANLKEFRETQIQPYPSLPHYNPTCDDFFLFDKLMSQSELYNPDWPQDSRHSATEFAQAALVNALNDFLGSIYVWSNDEDNICTEALKKMLNGPGMWNGFLPTLIIFGILSPVLLSVAIEVFQCMMRPKTRPAERPALSEAVELDLTPDEKIYDNNAIELDVRNSESKENNADEIQEEKNSDYKSMITNGRLHFSPAKKSTVLPQVVQNMRLLP